MDEMEDCQLCHESGVGTGKGGKCEMCFGAGECTPEQVEDWSRRRQIEVNEWAKRFSAKVLQDREKPRP